MWLKHGILLSAGLALSACAPRSIEAEAPAPCTTAWFDWVESRVGTGDGAGHGPDVGSEEWRSVVEFKLGLRGRSAVPARDSASWCTYIDDHLD